jgi:hypothetical protein
VRKPLPALTPAVRTPALDSAGRVLGGPFGQRVPNEHPSGALALAVRVGPAVRDRREDAVFVVPDPGAAGLLVAGGDDSGVRVDRRGRDGRAVDRLVAVRRDGDRRPLEDAPGENECAHGA